MREIQDMDKFILEQIYCPYQSMLGFEKRLNKLPYSLDETIFLLKEDSEWSIAVLDRILRCNFKFNKWIVHPIKDMITEQYKEFEAFQKEKAMSRRQLND